MSKRKVLLSFLGTGDYVRCSYAFPNGEVAKDVQFIQEALQQVICKDWTADDRFYVLLTQGAEKRNWETDSRFAQHMNPENFSYDKYNPTPLCGLKEATQNQDTIPLTPITDNITEGYSVEDIWTLFNTMTSLIQEDDEVHLDITHGFRSLPMLGMVLLNYLTVTKKITVGGIYYGAFEALGQASSIRESKPLEERVANILDLLPYHSLQQWTIGADNFIKYGATDTLETSINAWAGSVLRNDKNNSSAKKFSSFKTGLAKIFPLLSTNRLMDIEKGREFVELQERCNEVVSIENTGEISALKPLLQIISKEIEPFRNSTITNGFAATELALKHNMIQQAITLLRETLLSIIIDALGYENHFDESLREPASGTIGKIAKMKRASDREKSHRSILDIIDSLNKDGLSELELNVIGYLKENNWLADIYINLADLRNDINHAGIQVTPTGANRFKKTIGDIYLRITTELNYKIALPKEFFQ